MKFRNVFDFKWSFLPATNFGILLIILQSFSRLVMSTSNHEPYGGAIVFPDESPMPSSIYRMNHYHNSYRTKQDQQEKIVFPTNTNSFRNMENPRPRKQQYHRGDQLDRHLADTAQTFSSKTVQYSSFTPQDPSNPRKRVQQPPPQYSQYKILKHNVRLNNLKKDRPQSVKERSYDSENDNGNSQELIDVFLKWVEKCYPFGRIKGKETFDIKDKIKAASNETFYSLTDSLNDTKCPKDHKMTSEGCKKTVPVSW